MPKKPVTIFSWNVNGIRAVHKKGSLLPFIAKYQPDILCLQETKAMSDDIPIEEKQRRFHELDAIAFKGKK